MNLTLQELEKAINYWRTQHPATGEECALSPEVNVLATLYALMIFHRLESISMETVDPAARQLVASWHKQSAGQDPAR